jgi:hypothetical protein
LEKPVHIIEIILDGKKIRTEAKDINLKIDGTSFYKSKLPTLDTQSDELKVATVQTFRPFSNY